MLRRILEWLLGIVRRNDLNADESLPDTKTEVVKPVVRDPAGKRPYMTGAMIALLAAIRRHESGKAGYNADYANDDRWDLVHSTFDKVRQLARSQVLQGEPSSAIGAYQFLTKTLDSLKSSLDLTGDERFDVVLQDDLAVALMIRRGYMRYMRGEISAVEFANNLAKEWASLPVVSKIQGASRVLKPGQSYYAGDGLNKALHKPEAILDLVEALKE